ncbi:MAG: electron transport complex subunit RsxC [Clostridia bacterium]|nr:electron transport complex subunit RsxC [Clostridia bacterium]
MGLTFRGGIHPLHREAEGKASTSGIPIKEMTPPAIVRIPLAQNLGKPPVPCVNAGDRVRMGQKIADADGFMSVPLHSSVSGTVLGIEQIPGLSGKPETAIVIENDFTDEKDYMQPRDYRTMEPHEIVAAIQEGGIVGMGGAAFPTHVKLSVPPQKKVDLLIINGAECEPFLTADQRLMIERPDVVLYGTQVMMQALGVKRALIGIEDNKPDAIAVMSRAAEKVRNIRVKAVQTKYPQGYEKTLIYALTGRKVPAGGLPMDAQVVVVNAASAAAVADLFQNGEPSIQRITTVTGAVEQPCNILLRIGTSIQDAIHATGSYSATPMKIISGGPMMGKILPTIECPVTKSTSGILTLDSHFTELAKETKCIRCSRCLTVCPMFLEPVLLMDATVADDFETAEGNHAMDCMSCGSCSYICPANRPLAQSIAFAKSKIQAKRLLEKQKKEAAE